MSALFEVVRASVEARALPPKLPSGTVKLVVIGDRALQVTLGPTCAVRESDEDAELTIWLSKDRAEALLRGEMDPPLRVAGRTELLKSLAEMVKPTTSPLGTRLG
jgi:hypothetical protein